MRRQRHTAILADDHPMMLEGLSKLLEPSLDIVARVLDGEMLVETAERHQPDLVVTDISMPGVDGIEATRRLTIVSPRTRTVVLSIHHDSSRVRSAFDAGAWGYLPKNAVADEVETAIQEVLDGRYYVSPSVTRALVSPSEGMKPSSKAQPQPGREILTPRELEVSRLVGEGWSNKKIAQQLGIAVTTVRTHLSSVYAKLEKTSRIELALFANRAEKAKDDR